MNSRIVSALTAAAMVGALVSISANAQDAATTATGSRFTLGVIPGHPVLLPLLHPGDRQPG